MSGYVPVTDERTALLRLACAIIGHRWDWHPDGGRACGRGCGAWVGWHPAWGPLGADGEAL